MRSLSGRLGSHYRTRLLGESQAQRFARCLAANPRFSSVHVEESRRAPGSYYVVYVPASPVRREAMVESEQASRTHRAEDEGGEYLFAADRDSGRLFHWCLSTSGEVYEVTPQTCSCPDHYYRCGPCGLRCKHQVALTLGLGRTARW